MKIEFVAFGLLIANKKSIESTTQHNLIYIITAIYDWLKDISFI